MRDVVRQIARQSIVEAGAGGQPLHAPVLHIFRNDRPQTAAALHVPERYRQTMPEQHDTNRLVRVAILTADTTHQKRPVFRAWYDIGGFDGGEGRIVC